MEAGSMVIGGAGSETGVLSFQDELQEVVGVADRQILLGAATTTIGEKSDWWS